MDNSDVTSTLIDNTIMRFDLVKTHTESIRVGGSHDPSQGPNASTSLLECRSHSHKVLRICVLPTAHSQPSPCFPASPSRSISSTMVQSHRSRRSLLSLSPIAVHRRLRELSKLSDLKVQLPSLSIPRRSRLTGRVLFTSIHAIVPHLLEHTPVSSWPEQDLRRFRRVYGATMKFYEEAGEERQFFRFLMICVDLYTEEKVRRVLMGHEREATE